MSLLALSLYEHIPGWFAHLAETVARWFFGASPTGDQVAKVEITLYGWLLVVPGLLILSVLGTRNLTRVPRGLQNLLEAVVSLLDGFVKGMVGEKHYRYFANYLGAMFIYIHISNLWGMVPGMAAMTSIASTTVALALCTFVMTHYAGLRFAGLGYFNHFVGDPKWLGPLNVPIHFVGELARPVSLALRLMGNIGGEEKALAIFISLGMATGLFLPVQAPLMVLGLLTTFIQALVFCLLSAVYIAGALPHEHHDDHHGHEHDEMAGAPAHLSVAH